MTRLLIGLVLGALVTGCGTPDVLEATDPAEVTIAGNGVAVERVWSAGVGGAGHLNHGLEPALSADGKLFAAGAGSGLYAFDARSGKRLWRKPVAGRSLAGGPAVGEGVVVVGTRTGDVLGFAPKDGKARWESGVTSEVLAPATIGQGAVVVRSNDGRVFALEPDSGERRWLYDRNVPSLTLRGYSSPVLVQGGVLVGFDNGRLAALKLSDGAPAWEATVAVASGRTDIERMVDIDGDPVVDGTDVFATSYQGRAAGLAVSDGSIGWAREISSYNGPAVDDGKVYIADSDGRVWALDRFNGASVWRQDALESIELTGPRRFGEHLVVGGSDGYVYWLTPDDGRVVGRRYIGDGKIDAPPLVDGRWLYVQTARGRLVALRRPE